MSKRPWHPANQYPRGRGKLTCAICGEPLSEHEGVGRCPKAAPEALGQGRRTAAWPARVQYHLGAS